MNHGVSAFAHLCVRLIGLTEFDSVNQYKCPQLPLRLFSHFIENAGVELWREALSFACYAESKLVKSLQRRRKAGDCFEGKAFKQSDRSGFKKDFEFGALH